MNLDKIYWFFYYLIVGYAVGLVINIIIFATADLIHPGMFDWSMVAFVSLYISASMLHGNRGKWL